MGLNNALLLLEIILIIGVIVMVPYTEIDWRAYMQEVEGFLGGELNYTRLKGDTGPLVYPGGFVWLYSPLYFLTGAGHNIELAQWIYAAVYWASLAMVLSMYRRAHASWKLLLPLFISKRIRSVYVLRLFNDCWAMFFLYLAVSQLASRRRWRLGCFLFSVAVSVKMNILLFAPGLLYVLQRALPPRHLAECLAICVGWQLIAGAPFLLYDPVSYISRAFELGRVFTHRWSVNFWCIPAEFFENPRFGHVLLVATLVGWVVLWRLRWRARRYGSCPDAALPASVAADADASVAGVVEDEVCTSITLTMLESNLIGVIFARTLHYQFYSWFFYSVPLTLSFTRLPRLVRVGVFALIRQGFEGYPPTLQSSVMLLSGFTMTLMAVLFYGTAVRLTDETTAAAGSVPAEGLKSREAPPSGARCAVDPHADTKAEDSKVRAEKSKTK